MRNVECILNSRFTIVILFLQALLFMLSWVGKWHDKNNVLGRLSYEQHMGSVNMGHVWPGPLKYSQIWQNVWGQGDARWAWSIDIGGSPLEQSTSGESSRMFIRDKWSTGQDRLVLLILRWTFDTVGRGEEQWSGEEGANGLSPRKSRVLDSLQILIFHSLFLLSSLGTW